MRQKIRTWLYLHLPGVMDFLDEVGTARLKRAASHRSCPECGKTPDPHWSPAAPDMRDDRVAAMLGIWPSDDICGRCGARVGSDGRAAG